MSHTPGPWKAYWQRSYSYNRVGNWGFVSREGTIEHREVRTFNCSEEDPECAANARLIAAAPEMLAVLEALVGVADYASAAIGDDNTLNSPTLRRLIDRARAAIAKAEGGAA